MNYRKDIQILRGVAVVFVVLFHLEIGGFQSGFLGVDVFFVISGFLMAVLYKNDKVSEFIYRRAKRLLPAYFTTIVLTIITTALIATPVEFNSVKEQSLFALSFTSNVGFWLENSYFSKAEFKPLLHLWSLGVEIQFYLLVPLVFFAFKKNKYIFHSIFFVSLILCFVTLYISSKSSFFLIPFRIWEFLIGYYVVVKLTSEGNVKTSPEYRWIGLFALVLLILIPLIEVNGSSKDIIFGHPGMFALLITILTAIVLSLGLPQWFEKSVIGKKLELMGKYSYSIYLVHFPIIVLFLYQPLSGTILKPETYTQLTFIIFLITIFSLLMFNKVESSKYMSKKFSVALILPILVIISLISGTVIQNNRVNLQEQVIYKAWTDRSEYRCGLLNRVLNPLAKTCKLNNDEYKKSVLLVGNSHADSIKTSFVLAANQQSKNVWFFTSNSPLMNDAINAKVVVDEAIRINAREIFLHFSPKAISKLNLKKVVIEADNHNIKVSFIMPVPIWEKHIPKALIEKHQMSIELPIQNITDYRSQNRELINFLNTIELSNFRVLDVSAVFCNPHCKIQEKDGRPLYFDEGHLTLTGSRMLLESMKKWLK